MEIILHCPPAQSSLSISLSIRISITLILIPYIPPPKRRYQAQHNPTGCTLVVPVQKALSLTRPGQYQLWRSKILTFCSSIYPLYCKMLREKQKASMVTRTNSTTPFHTQCLNSMKPIKLAVLWMTLMFLIREPLLGISKAAI